MYNTPDGNEDSSFPPKSHQACLSCKKQKRKCDKLLPTCSLCQRMQRNCDYSAAPATPSKDDIMTMQRQILELTARIDSQGGGLRSSLSGRAANGLTSPPTTYTTPSSSLSGPDTTLGGFSYPVQPLEYPLSGVQNRFPALVFLDSDTFKHGGYVVSNILWNSSLT